MNDKETNESVDAMDDSSINIRTHTDYENMNKEWEIHAVQVSIKLPNEKKNIAKETLFEDVSGSSTKFVYH